MYRYVSDEWRMPLLCELSGIFFRFSLCFFLEDVVGILSVLLTLGAPRSTIYYFSVHILGEHSEGHNECCLEIAERT